MKAKVLSILAMLFLAFALLSCQTKEKRELSSVITREGAKKLGRDVAKIFDSGKTYMEGFLDGLGDIMKSKE